MQEVRDSTVPAAAARQGAAYVLPLCDVVVSVCIRRIARVVVLLG